MAAASTMLLASMAVGNAYSQAQASKAQGIAEQAQAEQNARLAEMQAKDAEARGEREAGLQRQRTRALIGKQKATLAAQGLSISDGTALELIGQTAEFGEADAATIRQNAYREAFGYRSQAMNYRNQGEFSYMGRRNEAHNTLLTGGMQAAAYGSDWIDSKFKSTPKSTPVKANNAGQSNKDRGNYA